MLTDAILKEATGAVVEFRLSAIADEGEPHIFSDRFERKMKKLIHRAEHPMQYRVLRVAAAIVLAITTLFGGVIAASPEVRAEVVEWLKSTFAGGIRYVTDSENSSETALPPYDYRLSAVPEGYEEYSVLDSTSSKHYTYINGEGQALKFAYKYPMGAGGVDIYGNYEYCTGFVNGVPAELYISPDGSEASVIVWHDPETEAILWLKAWENAEILIEIAQTVERIHK